MSPWGASDAPGQRLLPPISSILSCSVQHTTATPTPNHDAALTSNLMSHYQRICDHSTTQRRVQSAKWKLNMHKYVKSTWHHYSPLAAAAGRSPGVAAWEQRVWRDKGSEAGRGAGAGWRGGSYRTWSADRDEGSLRRKPRNPGRCPCLLQLREKNMETRGG